VVVAPRVRRAALIATGFVSHTLCAQVFVSGLDPARVYADTLEPVPGIRLLGRALGHEVDRTRREARATLVGAFASRAVYRDGVGCIVVRGGAPADGAPRGRLARAATAALLPEIAGADVVEPVDPRLRAALDAAFAEPAEPPYRLTKAVVVVHDGRVVAERYAPGYGVTTAVPGYSDTKAVVSALVGILVREGRLAVEQLAPVAAWREPGDPRHAITVDHLLRMTSGLAWFEHLSGGGPDTTSRMLFVERDMAGFAASVPLEAPPGTRWNYNSGNTLILSRIIRDAVGGRPDDVLSFAHRELFDPLGMRHVTLEFDATGTPVGSSAMFAAARDWARFGMLYLADGVVGGRRILPPGWVRYSAKPTPDAWVGYGAAFWTNLGTNVGATRRRSWGMPADSFFASGFFGQLVVVVPSERLVVARFGVSHGPRGDAEGVSRLVGAVVAALHGRPG
jgi:CubicO group peptidase (beta-lactamase class C family)